MKKLIVILILMFGSHTYASTLDCLNLYVGIVSVRDGQTLVVFKNNQSDSSGSYAQNFNGWPDSDKNAALSVLLAAKMSGHRVYVGTNAASGCDIHGPNGAARTLTYVTLHSNP